MSNVNGPLTLVMAVAQIFPNVAPQIGKQIMFRGTCAQCKRPAISCFKGPLSGLA